MWIWLFEEKTKTEKKKDWDLVKFGETTRNQRKFGPINFRWKHQLSKASDNNEFGNQRVLISAGGNVNVGLRGKKCDKKLGGTRQG